ncbi:response regulator [Pseudomonas sp. PDM18]|nr:response regulator [Pseudomonas sp. PDM18]
MSRILIVDEQPLTREALRLLLENDRHEVVGEADNGPSALQQARDCNPDIMILDLSIPRLGGLEVVQRLATQESRVKTLVLTSQDSEYFAGRCVSAGATGFVSKQADPQEVLLAVRAITKGLSYFPSSRMGTVNVADKAVLNKLSVRELSVLQLLAKGMSNIAIADQLAISDKTVSTYKVRLMEKMRAKSLVELIDISRRHGLVEGDSGKAESPQLSEDQLEELELLRRTMDELPHPITIRALDTRILYCNKATLELLGVSEEEIIGKRVGELAEFADPNEAELLREDLASAIQAGEPYQADVEVQLKIGRLVLRHWGRPYRDKRGVLIGAICGSVNVTDQDDVVRDLRNANARIEVISHGKTEYLRGIAEEIQGPLQKIIAMINLRLGKDESDVRDKPLVVARSVSFNLLSILDEVKLLCRVKAGRIRLVKEKADLRELVNNQLDNFRSQAQAKGLELSSDFNLALQPKVWCDALRLQQILQLLLDNAIKYTEEGVVLVRLSARGQGQGLVEVIMDVEDTGVGILEPDQIGLFEPFSYDLDGMRVGQGRSSLGLAICKSLVTLMGGDISAKSRVGVGTEIQFKLSLPDARG